MINNNTNFIRNGSGAAKKIHIIQPSLPDLADSILYAPTVAAVGQPMTITNRISNIGPGVTYPANWSDYIWLSTDFVPGKWRRYHIVGQKSRGRAATRTVV